MRRPAYSAAQSWRWPALILVATVLALVAALFEDDGWLDVLCALVLGGEVALCLWYGALVRHWPRRR